MRVIVAAGVLVLSGAITAPVGAAAVRDSIALGERHGDTPAHNELEKQMRSGREMSVQAFERLLDSHDHSDGLNRAWAVAWLACGRGRSRRKPAWDQNRVVEQLLQLARRETQVQVFEEVVRALGTQRDTADLKNLLIEALPCDSDEPFLRAIVLVSHHNPDPALVQPLLRLWSTSISDSLREHVLLALAAQQDSSAVPVGLDALAKGHRHALYLLERTATTEEAPLLVNAFHEYRERPQFPVRGLLELIASLGGAESTKFLKAEFERASTDKAKRHLAMQVLRSQLERDKPTWTDADQRACVPHEDVRKKSLPYLRAEGKRLTDRSNDEYWRQANWRGAGAEEFRHSLRFAFRAQTLTEQVNGWRHILEILEDSSGNNRNIIREQGTAELARALARRASVLATVDIEQSLRDADEALRLAGTTKIFGSPGRLEDFKSVQRRAVRLSGDAKCSGPTVSIGSVTGVYYMSTGYTGAELTIHAGHTFDRTSRSDAMDLCTWGKWRDAGSVHIEGEYVVLTVEPTASRMLASNALGPEVYAALRWGNRKYLVAEANLLGFCNDFNRREPRDVTWGHYHSKADGPVPKGVPTVPCERIGWLLADRIDGTVDAIEEHGCLRVLSDQAQDLKPGMWLYGKAPGATGIWTVVDIDHHMVRACPKGSGSRAVVGGQVSTRDKVSSGVLQDNRRHPAGVPVER